jgi:GMP synthase (glutamine-hydrolysing)
MGSPVVASRFTGKVGTYEVELTKHGVADPLFAEFPDTFLAHYGHRDIVALRPQEATLLAHGRLCHNAMLRYKKHIYTSQFHPELDSRLVQKYLGGHTAYTQASVKQSELKDAPDAENLPIRFIHVLRNRMS